jgi:hypothetical protein
LKPKFLLSRYFFLSVLLILILTAFGGALRNEFTWDDRIVVLPEQAYRSADIVRILSTPANSLEYQPIRDLTFALDFTLWGEWSLGFHLTSLLLYLAGVVSVWVVAEALLKRLGVESYRMAALITAALFPPPVARRGGQSPGCEKRSIVGTLRLAEPIVLPPI